MYKLKSIARRMPALVAAVAVLAGTLLPVTATYADALNPLTQRSLTLSSSSPGWSSTDGSGNSTYAEPNSGANGFKTGETFSFKNSTDSTSSADGIQAMTFQYCTGAAGDCTAPGNDATHGTDNLSSNQTDLNVVTSTPSEVSQTTWDIIKTGGSGRAQVPLSGIYNGLPKMDNSEGNFVVLTGSGTGTVSDGWTMTSSNLESSHGVDSTTGSKNNLITLTNSTGIKPAADTQFRVVFFGTTSNYITNPGAGAFFVKINDYSNTTDITPTTSTHIIDGGVTVANVMNQSIEIQTKVLETMEFSVGTVDPNTLASDNTTASAYYAASHTLKHGQCDPILTSATYGGTANVLQLGNSDQENSLETAHTFSTHSYWRLSSNSSAGATVYYSGETLSNTEGDQIKAIGPGIDADAPHPGTEQFGLALDNADDGNGNLLVDYGQERDTTGTHPENNFEDAADNGLVAVDASTTSQNSGTGYHVPTLSPLLPETGYGSGTGDINGSPTTEFAFDPSSNTVPAALASESSAVVNCVTGKVRYIANIAATTPAGIYTTKVNYIAAPQY